MVTHPSLSDFVRWGVAWRPRSKPLMRVLLPAASRSHDHFGHENWDHQLKLAVAWNRVDIARSEIFTDERQWKVRLRGVPWGGACWDSEQGQALRWPRPDPSSALNEGGWHVSSRIGRRRHPRLGGTGIRVMRGDDHMHGPPRPALSPQSCTP